MNANFSLITILNFFYMIFVLLISLSVHETAHAYIAEKRGDPTGRMLGRISLNPLRHLDLVGSFIVPVVLFLLKLPAFGWAKPVPINPRNFKNIRVDSALVSSAGPLSNLLLTIISVFFMAIYLLIVGQEQFYAEITNSYTIPNLLLIFSQINLLLMAFNLLPIFPLDGSYVFEAFLPKGAILNAYEKIKPYGFLILLLLIMTPILDVFFRFAINGLLKIFVLLPLSIISNIFQ